MLTKLVDGKTIVLSDEEERQQRAFWALNDKYPEYTGHCGWDGVNEPFHDMVECRKHHAKLMGKACQDAIAELRTRIEIAMEDGDTALVNELMVKRKAIRQHIGKDFSSCKTVDDLRSSIPEELKPYWNK